MQVVNKQSPTCTQKGCIGWIEEIMLRNELWRRCRTCGWMEKVSKRTIKPMRDS